VSRFCCSIYGYSSYIDYNNKLVIFEWAVKSQKKTKSPTTRSSNTSPTTQHSPRSPNTTSETSSSKPTTYPTNSPTTSNPITASSAKSMPQMSCPRLSSEASTSNYSNCATRCTTSRAPKTIFKFWNQSSSTMPSSKISSLKSTSNISPSSSSWWRTDRSKTMLSSKRYLQSIMKSTKHWYTFSALFCNHRAISDRIVISKQYWMN